MPQTQKVKKTRSKLKIVIFVLVIIVILGVVAFGVYKGIMAKQRFAFSDHLSDTAATINGETLTYKDLSFYVLYEELKVENEAKIYNPESTKDWWNTHINGEFISVSAKNTAMNMAIHDKIMYDLAKKNNMSLTEEDRVQLNYKKTDFWEDLLDEQRERLPASKEFINETMEHIALGEKYQAKLAADKHTNAFEYAYDGYEYGQMLKNDYKVEIDDNYKKLEFGEITIHHDKVNYVNGINLDNMKERLKK